MINFAPITTSQRTSYPYFVQGCLCSWKIVLQIVVYRRAVVDILTCSRSKLYFVLLLR